MLESRWLLSSTRPFGDANSDAKVDSLDFNAVAVNFNCYGDAVGQIDGDFNADKIVNALDFNALASNYGRVIPRFDPAVDVSGLTVSLDADSLNVADKTAIPNWPGADGTGFSATQIDTSEQPRLRSAAMNGHNGVQFDGFNDFLNLPNVNSQLPGSATLVVVFDNWEDDSYTLMGTSANNGIDRFWEGNASHCGTLRQTRLENPPIALPSNGSHVMVIRSENEFWDIWLNGQQVFSTTNNTFTADSAWYLGAWNNYDSDRGSGSFDGLISRVLVYNNVISNNDVTNISDWAVDRYALNKGVVPASPIWKGGTGKRYWHVFMHSNTEEMWIGESDDGTDVENEGRILIDGYSGPARDPSYHFASGVHYIAFTNASVIDFPDHAVSDHFSIIRSTDGVHFSFYGTVDLSSIFTTPGNNYTWAPQWFEENDHSLWLIVTTSDDQSVFHFYAVPVQSLLPLVTGAPQLIDQPLTNAIDAQIVKQNGKYRMFIAPGSVRMMESDNLLGPYSQPVQISAHGREGPCLVQVGSETRIYYDAGGSRYIASLDGGETFPILGSTRGHYLEGHGDVVDRDLLTDLPIDVA